MPDATKVLYDVSQAIKELEKLNKKVEEAGEKANEAFEKGGDSAKKFDTIMKALPKGVQEAVTASRAFVTTWGGAGVVLGGAALGIAAVAANLLDLKDLLRDTTANYEAFTRATERLFKQRETLGDFTDAGIERDLEFAKRGVRLEQADNKGKQNLLEAERNAAKDRLEVVQEEIRNRERIVKDGLKREEDLRKRLRERNETNAAESFGGPSGKRTLDLAAAASKAAQEGNVDLAEELLDAAKDQSAELGNHALFLKAIDAANANINRSLERQIAAQDRVNDSGKADLDRLTQLEGALKNDIKGNEDKLQLIQQQNRELSRQLKLLRDASLAQQEQDRADTASNKVGTAAKNVNEFFRSGPSVLEDLSKAVDSFQQAVLGGGARDQAAVDTLQSAAFKELGKVAEVAARINQGENVSATEISKLIPSLEKVGKLGEILQVAEDQGRVPKGSQIENDVNRLQTAIEQAFKLLEGTNEFRAVRGDDAAIREGSAGPSREDMRALTDSILQLKGSIEQPSRAGAAIQPNTQPQSQGAPRPATNTQSNITVNANVKGGIIDAETTRTITQIIRQELRKQTSAAPA